MPIWLIPAVAVGAFAAWKAIDRILSVEDASATAEAEPVREPAAVRLVKGEDGVYRPERS